MMTRFANDLRCLNHSSPNVHLSLRPLYCENDECIEGFLTCQFCLTAYPIIEGVAVLVNDFVKYCESRVTTFGRWLVNSKTSEMKNFLKSRGRSISSSQARNDRYEEGGAWYAPYGWLQNGYSLDDKLLRMLRQRLKPNEFYDTIVHLVKPKSHMVVLDMGCSMGYSTLELAKKCTCALGIDLSFSFILEARMKLSASKLENVEFFVSDALQAPFSSMKFDLIFALNILELIERNGLLLSIHKLLKRNAQCIFADPYNYRLKSDSTRIIDGQTFRAILKDSGFELMRKTFTESHIPWIIKIDERSYLFYFVDLVRGKKV